MNVNKLFQILKKTYCDSTPIDTSRLHYKVRPLYRNYCAHYLYFCTLFLFCMPVFIHNFFEQCLIFCAAHWHCLLSLFHHFENYTCHAFFFTYLLFFGMISIADVTKAFLNVSHFEFPFSFSSLYLHLTLPVYFFFKFEPFRSLSYCKLDAALALVSLCSRFGFSFLHLGFSMSVYVSSVLETRYWQIADCSPCTNGTIFLCVHYKFLVQTFQLLHRLFPFLLWHSGISWRLQSPVICIEPWCSLADSKTFQFHFLYLMLSEGYVKRLPFQFNYKNDSVAGLCVRVVRGTRVSPEIGPQQNMADSGIESTIRNVMKQQEQIYMHRK